MKSLTDEQTSVLHRLAREPGEGVLTTRWIAEACGHYDNNHDTRRRLLSLARRGLVLKLDRSYWKITPAGRAALTS